jgi:hypothetical protein
VVVVIVVRRLVQIGFVCILWPVGGYLLNPHEAVSTRLKVKRVVGVVFCVFCVLSAPANLDDGRRHSAGIPAILNGQAVVAQKRIPVNRGQVPGCHPSNEIAI